MNSQNQNQDQNQPESQNTQSQYYWRSLEQWAGDPEFKKLAETEFQSSPLREDANGTQEEGWARREFLKLMGASLAMTTASCIRRPVQKIVPYNKQPEEVTFGETNFYTSTFSDGNETLGLLVRTREGRPLKLDGNPSHPYNKGGISARAQSSILSLYDPERLRGPVKQLQNPEAKDNAGKVIRNKRSGFDSIQVKYEEADDAIVKTLKKGGVAVLTGNLTSPSAQAVVRDFSQAFKAKHYSWEPLSFGDIRMGQEMSYGQAVVPAYRFDKAKVIVSVNCDFLGTWLAPTMFSRQFAEGRKNPKEMNKLVVFDSAYSLTGANADIRFRIKPSQSLDVVMALAHHIVVKKSFSSYAGQSSVNQALAPFALTSGKLGIPAEAFEKLASDLIANKGQSLIVAGGAHAQTANAEALQIAVNFLNSVLGNDGQTVEGRSGQVGLTATPQQMTQLIEAIEKGEVKSLIIHRSNPLYSYANQEKLRNAFRKLDLIVYSGDRSDETGQIADYILPDHHALENWGDADFGGGVYSIQQPTIRPMYDTRSFGLSLMTWGYIADQGPKDFKTLETYYDYVRSVWRNEIHSKAGKGLSFDSFWEKALQDGFVGTKESSSARAFQVSALNNVKPLVQNGWELVLYPTVMFAEGSLSNVSWLHELPDPVTKVVWDNFVSVSIATAEKLSLSEGDMLEIQVGQTKTSLPVHIQPGLHDSVLAVALGYGRTHAGKVGNLIGHNAYSFAQVNNKGMIQYSGISAEIKKGKGHYQLAATQSHHAMEGRQIVAEATLKQFLKDEGAGIHKHPIFSIWGGHAYNGHKWGMAVDLNLCTGCASCQIACQSENNIPVVGKKYVLQGREMHWIRIDRYYVGDPKEAEVAFQPVMCQQCDNAPCETVCPVLATVHTDEGLNDMVYNRCVGTRYCSNNCPYKVRRFNWFNYTKNIEKPLHMALNPDVTVRMRGVMEKCTFCTHRIKTGKVKAKVEQRELKDGDIKTACQEACPTQAIVFGDLNNDEAAVTQLFKKNARAYALLEEFHAAPSVRYLSKIRNNDQDSRGTESQGEAHKGGHA